MSFRRLTESIHETILFLIEIICNSKNFGLEVSKSILECKRYIYELVCHRAVSGDQRDVYCTLRIYKKHPVTPFAYDNPLLTLGDSAIGKRDYQKQSKVAICMQETEKIQINITNKRSYINF